MGCVVCHPVPADVISIADKNHHIEIRYLPLINLHGALWYWNNEWIVQLNTNESLENRKFTLFHEAFHILAFRHTSSVSTKMDSRKKYFNELLADQFAMCILMPSKWVIKVWQDTNSIMKIPFIIPVDISPVIVQFRQSSPLSGEGWRFQGQR